jgi:hypothetical protein
MGNRQVSRNAQKPCAPAGFSFAVYSQVLPSGTAERHYFGTKLALFWHRTRNLGNANQARSAPR